MSDNIRQELVYTIIDNADAITDFDCHNDINLRYEFKKQIILNDESLNLTKDEKTEAIRILTRDYDYFKVLYNEGEKRTCEHCRRECLATLYCEHCVRNFLASDFFQWTSGNVDIDNLIQI